MEKRLYSRAAGAIPPRTSRDVLVDRGPKHSLFGLSFHDDGTIESSDGTRVSWSAIRLGVPIGDSGVVSNHPTPTADDTLQFENEGAHVRWDGTRWWMHTPPPKPLPAIPMPEDPDATEPTPRAVGYWMQQIVDKDGSLQVFANGTLRLGSTIVWVDEPMDFVDAQGFRFFLPPGIKTLRIYAGGEPKRVFSTQFSWRWVFGAPVFRRWYSFHLRYPSSAVASPSTPDVAIFDRFVQAVDRLWQWIDSTQAKAVVLWLLFLAVPYTGGVSAFLALLVAAHWQPTNIPAWCLPDDILDD
jgi:hypothetical protein